MTHRFLQVSLNFATTPSVAAQDALEAEITRLSTDWMRLSGMVWILWTSKSTVTVAEMLRDKINQETDQMMVLGLDQNEPFTGWAPGWVWQWLNRQRDPLSGAAFGPEPTYISETEGLLKLALDVKP